MIWSSYSSRPATLPYHSRRPADTERGPSQKDLHIERRRFGGRYPYSRPTTAHDPPGARD